MGQSAANAPAAREHLDSHPAQAGAILATRLGCPIELHISSSANATAACALLRESGARTLARQAQLGVAQRQGEPASRPFVVTMLERAVAGGVQAGAFCR